MDGQRIELCIIGFWKDIVADYGRYPSTTRQCSYQSRFFASVFHSATIHRPFSVRKDCAGFCMSLLTNTADYQPTTVFCRNRIQMRLTPASLVTALNSFPLLGERSAKRKIFDTESEWQDLNLRPLDPKSSVLPNWTTFRFWRRRDHRPPPVIHISFILFHHTSPYLQCLVVLWVCSGCVTMRF